MRLPCLQELLLYRNETVVNYFCQHYPTFSLEKAHQLFNDLLGWMWLTTYRKTSNRHTYLFGPLLDIDNIWHAFILHSRAYHLYCEQYFGDYFHHDIETHGLEHRLSSTELEDFLKDCFELLGDGWVDRHFALALG